MPTVIVPLSKLCEGYDVTKSVVVEIWDYDFECPHDFFMGFCYVSIYDMFVACLRKSPISLQPGQAGHPWSGNLFAERIPTEGNDFNLDPISTSTILHLSCAIGDVDKA
jgi:hypothetical protein